jgi:hypothetical protein
LLSFLRKLRTGSRNIWVTMGSNPVPGFSRYVKVPASRSIRDWSGILNKFRLRILTFEIIFIEGRSGWR